MRVGDGRLGWRWKGWGGDSRSGRVSPRLVGVLGAWQGTGSGTMLGPGTHRCQWLGWASARGPSLSPAAPRHDRPGNYRDKVRSAGENEPPNITEQITVRQSKDAGSHTAGFEAWLRGRGSEGIQVFTADDVAERFGVVKGSYDPVPLPRIRAHAVRCSGAGAARDVLAVDAEELPAELEWGQVLVSVRCAPINPADLYTVATGGSYGTESVPAPFVPGHDAVGVVVKVRSGGREGANRPDRDPAGLPAGQRGALQHDRRAGCAIACSPPPPSPPPNFCRRVPGSRRCTRTTGWCRSSPSWAPGAPC